MTCCLAIAVDEGLVFASDSRTNAGPDQVATYGKMHTFTVPGERLLVVLSAGNLATTQAVMARIRRDIDDAQATVSLRAVDSVEAGAEYLGTLLHEQEFPKNAAHTPYDDIAWSLDYMLGLEIEPVNDRAVFQALPQRGLQAGFERL